MKLGMVLVALAGLVAAAPARAQEGGQVSDRMRVNGYTNLEFEYNVSHQGKGDSLASFDAQEFDLVFNVFPSDRLRVGADLRWEHGVATEDGLGNAALVYGFAEYTVADALRLRAGKMTIPFGIYNEIYTSKPTILTFKEPLTMVKANKYGFPRLFYPRAGAGLEALGDLRLGAMDADYTLLVTNGESLDKSLNTFEQDNNVSKTITGRFRLNPTRDLRLGVSLYRDVLTELDSVGAPTSGRTHQLSYGASLEWGRGAFGAQLEYTGGYVEPSAGPRTTGNAYAALASYQVRNGVTPYVHMNRLDPNADVADDYAMIWGPGVHFRLPGDLHLKFEVNRFQSGLANSKLKGIDFTELDAAAAVAF
jgi:hypothetical protein